MSGQVAVAGADLGEALRQQFEMKGFLGRDADPIVKERSG